MIADGKVFCAVNNPKVRVTGYPALGTLEVVFMDGPHAGKKGYVAQEWVK